MSTDRHDLVLVARIPACDVCKHEERRLHPRPAVVDGKTKGGPWANMCGPHYKTHGVGLGLGKGQMLVLDESQNTNTKWKATDYVDGNGPSSVTMIGDWELPYPATVQQVDPPDGDEGHETIAVWLEWPDRDNHLIEAMIKVPVDFTITE